MAGDAKMWRPRSPTRRARGIQQLAPLWHLSSVRRKAQKYFFNLSDLAVSSSFAFIYLAPTVTAVAVARIQRIVASARRVELPDDEVGNSTPRGVHRMKPGARMRRANHAPAASRRDGQLNSSHVAAAELPPTKR